MLRIPFQFRGLPVFHLNQDTAGVRAI
jgi:hypothetical protein